MNLKICWCSFWLTQSLALKPRLSEHGELQLSMAASWAYCNILQSPAKCLYLTAPGLSPSTHSQKLEKEQELLGMKTGSSKLNAFIRNIFLTMKMLKFNCLPERFHSLENLVMLVIKWQSKVLFDTIRYRAQGLLSFLSDWLLQGSRTSPMQSPFSAHWNKDTWITGFSDFR